MAPSSGPRVGAAGDSDRPWPPPGRAPLSASVLAERQAPAQDRDDKAVVFPPSLAGRSAGGAADVLTQRGNYRRWASPWTGAPLARGGQLLRAGRRKCPRRASGHGGP
jgi:hypothetical protein